MTRAHGIGIFLALALTTVTVSTPALAQPATPMVQTPSDSGQEYAFGMRVGGYGFRNTQAESAAEKWNDCRMNGLGLFGQKHLTEHAFLEAGSDIYFSDDMILGEDSTHAENMDRLSGLLSVSAGLRMYPASRVSAYAQVGVGLELTRVTMGAAAHGHTDGPVAASAPAEMTSTRTLPMGFVGFGGDVRVGSRTRLGANFRTNLMAHFDHGEGMTTLEAVPEAANQVQFYLRYSL
ncbi:MAG TPA: outer membrane beta-barrel protein [Kofleriaceae bacterium]|nr:outer membrane beta-barrel protein [Kofleriaceae bacterium]